MVPDGDLFKAIRAATRRWSPTASCGSPRTGSCWSPARELDADIIVTATGLKLLAFGGMQLHVDGQPVNVNERLAYKSMMLSGVPEFRVRDRLHQLVVDAQGGPRLRPSVPVARAHGRHGYTTVMPVADDPTITRRPLLDFAAGYVQRSTELFPHQGSHGPWTVEMSYAADRARLRNGPVEDPALQFSASDAALRGAVVPEAATA